MAFTARTPNACIHAPCNSGTSASPAQALTNVQGIAPSSAILHLFRETVARQTRMFKPAQIRPALGPKVKAPPRLVPKRQVELRLTCRWLKSLRRGRGGLRWSRTLARPPVASTSHLHGSTRLWRDGSFGHSWARFSRSRPFILPQGCTALWIRYQE